MESFFSNIRKSILAGILIVAAGMTYLAIDDAFVGSLMFSFGLLAILYKGYNLYTGKVGFVSKLSDVPPLLTTLFGNLIGLTIGASIYRAVGTKEERLQKICEAKLSNEWWQVLLLAILCGVMMYLAVSLFRSSKNPLMVMMPISVFIMCGFEHSMASFFYFVSCYGLGIFQPKIIGYLLIMVIGNAIGSVVWRIVEVKNKQE